MQNFVQNAVVLTDGDLIFYYTGFSVDDGFLVILNGDYHLFTDGRYYEAACEQANAKVYLQSETPYQSFLKENGVVKVGLVYDYTSAKEYESLLSQGYSIYDYTSEHNELASIKTSDELSKIKTACEIAERAYLNTLPFIKEGITELELSAELEHNFKRLGAGVGFKTIVAFGKGSSVPHYKTGSVKLKKNTPILIDFGCNYQGFISDMTRTLFFGEPSEKFLLVYNAVKSAHLKAFNEIRSGMTTFEGDKIARDELDRFGLSKYFTHSLGHGIGVKVHEFPTLSPRTKTELKDGMVFSIEPGVYLEGEFGVRIEDTVALQNGKCVSMMTTDKDLLIIKG
ncbi:MAG: aminopeptidase P family protein [Clostridia bacterium]|nr:aminopeptidase P family protein [Clostridia bacterium]